MSRGEPTARTIVRTVLIVAAVVGTLYLIYLLRQPLSWIFFATFIAVALSAPVSALSRHMRRGFAIALTYAGVITAPLLILALIVPPLVSQATSLAEDTPRYAREVRDFINRNERLREIDRKYNVSDELERQAAKLPTKVGDAAGTLRDLGLGIVNSVFALLTILILSVFLLSGGPRWVDALLAGRPPDQRERLERVLERIATAIGGYVQGALTIAVIAGTSAFVVLTILGVPFAAPLGVVVGLFALIPLVGATIAAVIVGIVTLFGDFPADTIVWAVWAVVYQQIENNVIQPQIQKRTVNVQPFIVLVAVLFGSALLGVVGAIVAIPIAASIQIAVREWLEYRRAQGAAPVAGPAGPEPDVSPS